MSIIFTKIGSIGALIYSYVYNHYNSNAWQNRTFNLTKQGKTLIASVTKLFIWIDCIPRGLQASPLKED